MKNKFRASYSILSMWKSGNFEQAVKSYFKLEDFVTPAMADGRRWHENWEKEGLKTKSLPKIFGGRKLTNPKFEEKLVVQIYDWLELVGKIDCLDSPDIYDFKTGKATSETSASSYQLGIYGVICTMSKIYVDKGHILHYDQYKKTVDNSSVYLTDKLLKDSLNWIISISGDMHNYLETNNLYDRFKIKK